MGRRVAGKATGKALQLLFKWMVIPKLYRKFDCYDEYVPFPCIPLSGTTQIIVDIYRTEGHESHHLGRIYRSAG